MTQRQLNSMTISELQNLNRMVVDALKAKKTEAARSMKRTLSVGSRVSVNHPRLAGKVGLVTDIRKTRCVIQVDRTSYVVPMNMVETI